MKTVTEIRLMHGECEMQEEMSQSAESDYPVSFQTHSQCLIDHFAKKQKHVLFSNVFQFVKNLIENESFYTQICTYLTRNESPALKKTGSMQDEAEHEREPFKNLSFKKVQVSSNCFQSRKDMKLLEVDLVKQRRVSKKISLVIFGNEDEDDMFSKSSNSDSIISENEIKTLRKIKLPPLKLTKELVVDIFQAPSPFLMNLSLCLFIRYCIKRRCKPDWQEAAWILALATIEAFKIYYDEALEGMFECFEALMKITKKDLVDLERCFLEKIDYNVMVMNYDYQYVLEKFVQIEKVAQSNSCDPNC